MNTSNYLQIYKSFDNKSKITDNDNNQALNNSLEDFFEEFPTETNQPIKRLISTQNNNPIEILNKQSYPIVGDDWIIYFNTTGTNDLTITAVNGTSFSEDLLWQKLMCGETEITAEFNGEKSHPKIGTVIQPQNKLLKC